MSGQLLVNEIFHSIQGESTRAGLPCSFVRLAGCPLRCLWCDTVYARDTGDYMGIDWIVSQVDSLGSDLVEVTGGEPLAQPGVHQLLAELCGTGRTVLLETSGAIDIGPVDPGVHVIMDLKCPSSGMSGRMDLANIEKLGQKDEVKFVLACREDYDHASRMIARYELDRRCPVLLSVVSGSLENRTVVEWMLADRLPARFQLQMHKYIWPPEARGV